MEISSDSVIQTARIDEDMLIHKKISPTIEQLIEEKEKAKGIKRQKLFEYDDEW
jgi:hypothetical protein